VFGAQAGFSLQMNISTLFLIRQECASLPSPPPYPHPLPSKLPSSCNLERKPRRIFDRLGEISSVLPGVTLCLELELAGPKGKAGEEEEGEGCTAARPRRGAALPAGCSDRAPSCRAAVFKPTGVFLGTDPGLTSPRLAASSGPCAAPHRGNAAPTGRGHPGWPLAGGRGGEGCRCHVRGDVGIRTMFAPWETAQDRTLPISLPTHGHDSEANEPPPARQAHHGGDGCATPEPASTPATSPQSAPRVPRPVPMGCTASSGGTVGWEQWGDEPPSPQPSQKSDHPAQSSKWPWGPRASGDGDVLVRSPAPTRDSALELPGGTSAARKEGACFWRCHWERGTVFKHPPIRERQKTCCRGCHFLTPKPCTDTGFHTGARPDGPRQGNYGPKMGARPRAHKTRVCVSSWLHHHPQSGHWVPLCASSPAPEALQALASAPGRYP